MEKLVWVLLVAAISIVFGSYTAVVAKAKGYDTAGWFIGGFLFWFIPLIAIAGMPVLDQRTTRSEPESKFERMTRT